MISPLILTSHFPLEQAPNHSYLNIKHGIWVNLDVQYVEQIVSEFQFVLVLDLK